MEQWNYMRFARPTKDIDGINKFYGGILGLEKIGEFNHNGYIGVLYGLPDQKLHLEFLQSNADYNPSAPTEDNLLVFYFDSIEIIEKMRRKLESYGVFPVEPDNQYWSDKGYTFEDPEGWRVVFCIDIRKYYQGEKVK